MTTEIKNTTTSTTDAVMPEMTITPPKGTYALLIGSKTIEIGPCGNTTESNRMTAEIKNKIQELKSLRDKATVGPWLYSEIVEKDELGNIGGLCGVDVVSDSTLDVICNLDYDQQSDWKDSAKFIAESANRWNDLLKCLEVAVDALEKYNGIEISYSKFMPTEKKDVSCEALSEIKSILEK